NPAECVTYSNELLAKESVKNMFVTIFYGIYNIKTGDITYTNAGHNPPYILKANGTVETLPMSNNIIVGVFDDFTFSEETCHLDKGDTIVLFTDGVTEAIDIAEKEYGDDRIKDCLAKHSGNSCQQIIDAIKADVSNFVGEAEQSDDITLLALKRK
ncbi:MAG: serine/threonine-protein phosphatase, partial [Prevotella sp.]|nr:serine/threonine-protein phosphatase [Prevotella sp.]